MGPKIVHKSHCALHPLRVQCPAMACMLAFFFACARCCFRRGQLLVWAVAINAIRRPPNAERTANELWAHMPPAPCAFRSGRSAAKIPCSWRMHGTEKWPNVEIMTASEVRENRDALVSRPLEYVRTPMACWSAPLVHTSIYTQPSPLFSPLHDM